MNPPFPFLSFFPNHDFPCTKPHAKCWTYSKIKKPTLTNPGNKKTHSNPEWFCLAHLRCVYINTNISIYIYPMSSSYSTPAFSLESANCLAISNKRCLGASSSDFSKAWVASQRRCRWSFQRMWSPESTKYPVEARVDRETNRWFWNPY